MKDTGISESSDEVAIIGFAGRFPGARSADEFWQNLRNGVETISFFSVEELLSSGISPAVFERGNYVKAKGAIEDVELFDAPFFNFTAREAELTDPQHRIFLECAWEALESAGYDPEKYKGLIGVYAGTAMSSYLLNLYSNRALVEAVGTFQIGIGNDKDHLSTNVSYKLNLKGPSLSVQTSCSTSLVAVHIACQSLLNGECDMALAGGVTIKVPQKSGYLYRRGGITSPNGHCKAFDANAEGTVSGNGAGIVVLKRLSDALDEGDCIHAVIKGSAINNDGSLKVGYTAPSVQGQATVITDALNVAGVEPETVSYVEAHGTGTALGDPVEIAALTEAFRASTDKRGFCAIGSVKTNIGHLDTAAGVASLIKVVLALKHKMLPPSLHFTQPNPKINFADSPFYVNAQLREWSANGAPRRAGVSSFGIGGTNAHLIIEEAPIIKSIETNRPLHLMALSARTSTALEKMTVNLAACLKQHSDMNPADVAYTLQVGRRGFLHRRAVLCGDASEAVNALETLDPRMVFTGFQGQAKRLQTAFMFSGQGTQHVGMGKELYRIEESFHHQVDRCSKLLEPQMGMDLREVLYPPPEMAEEARRRLNETSVTQPVLFVIEYALAQMWKEWGIRPQAMIGHSVGEYVAACLAGVMSLEDALRLVSARGRLMQQMTGGAMLAVSMAEQEAKQLLGEQLSLAAVNGARQCVLSGPENAVVSLEAELLRRQVRCHRLPTEHAFHSAMMEPILERFRQEVGGVRLHAPRIPYISNVTGHWIKEAEATSASYWVSHIRQTVRFSQGLGLLLEQAECALLEIGPDQTLSNLAREQSAQASSSHLIVSTLGPAHSRATDEEHVIRALGKLWVAGVDVDWSGYCGSERRQRVALPTYPFERLRYWIDRADAGETFEKRNDRQNINNHPSPSGQKNTPLMDVGAKEHELMNATHAFAKNKTARYREILSDLKGLINNLTGAEPDQIDDQATYFEMGVSSLLLIQAVSAIEESFGVKITLVQFFDELATLDALATYLDEKLPPDARPEEMLPMEASPETDEIPSSLQRFIPASAELADSDDRTPLRAGEQISAPHNSMQDVMLRQIELMSQQLQVLNKASSITEPLSSPETASQSLLQPQSAKLVAAAARPQRNITARSRPDLTKAVSGEAETEVFVPFQTGDGGKAGSLTSGQKKHLDDLIGRYTGLTKKSKQLIQTYRRVFADPRSAAGFRRLWKEMNYPIIVQRSMGSKLWDVDGNEYVDLTMGFGVHLFGHSPAFIKEALEEQLGQGVQLGPQSYLAGQVAELICELTSTDRAVFCNSGTEAVMSALRVARAVTGRTKIAFFAGSYHGSFDGILARGITARGTRRIIPIAPGTPQGMVDDVLVLDYGTEESLEILKAHGDELAAVLVEPVQSRRPNFQPKAYLQEIRQLTEASATALIFDEVVTGFRVHAGGCQALFNVRADLVTYGKVVGGGMPIGVIAGRAEYMDAFDGGLWQFGDASFPKMPKTFFAGTFCKHPLAMAGALAVLNHIKTNGPELQEHLNQRTARLVATLNNYFEREQVSFRADHFGSLMSFTLPREMKHADLFAYHMVTKGVYVWEGSTRFLSTAHTDEDIDRVIQAVKESITELREGGFIPDTPTTALKAETLPYVSPGRELDSQIGSPSISSSILSPATSVESPAKAASAPGFDDEPHDITIPLTDAQKQLWLLAQMGEDASRAYNESVILRMRGHFDASAMRRAVQRLVNRHEALRTSFCEGGELQQVHASMTIDVPVVDLSYASEGERESLVAELIAKEAQQPFKLDRDQLLRVSAIKLEKQYHILALTFHHLVADGWSSGILLAELKTYYDAECQGIACELAPPGRYREYAQWEASPQQSLARAEAESYWLKEFSGPVPVLELPTDRPRPALKTYNGARETGTLGASLCGELKKLAGQNGCTLLMVMLAGYEVLLHRLAGQDDIVAGLPSAGQFAVKGESLFGHCVNMLPLRSRIATDTSFTHHLASVKKRVLEAFEHQYFSFISLVKKLNLNRDPSRSPLFSATFNFGQARSAAKQNFYGLEVSIASNDTGSSKFDVYLNIIERDGQLFLEFEYNTDLYDAETIQRWMRHFQTILEGMIVSPAGLVLTVPLLIQHDQQQLLYDWNQTRADYPQDRCVHELFDAQVEQNPQAIAVEMEGDRLSYKELSQRANKFAHYLRRLGVGPEARVAVLMERCPEMVVAILGVLKAGGAYVPMDPAYPADRINYMLEDAQAHVLLTQERFKRGLSKDGVEVICADRDWEKITLETDDIPQRETDEQNLAYVIYTSGSTGNPKGVMISHRGLVNYLSWCSKAYQVAEGTGVSLHSSIAFDLSITSLLAPLVAGQRVLLLPEDQGIEALATEIRSRRDLSLVKITPAHLDMLSQLLPADEIQGHIRSLILGGESLSGKKLTFWQTHARGTRIINEYGPTEAVVGCCVYEVPAGRSISGAVPIGRPIANTQLYILDGKLQPIPIGIAGELYIGGDGVARGYLNRPDLTAEKFIPSPFSLSAGARLYSTGDAARYLSDGNIEFLGRTDNQVKIKGFRIELGEVEDALGRHAAVRENVVVAREDSPGVKRLVAYVVLSQQQVPTVSELRSFLKERLPDYMLPSTFVTLETLPLTANGKVDREALPVPDFMRPALDKAYVAPRGPEQESLARIWAEVLRQDRVGVNDDFFELGGDSILSIQIVARANQVGFQLSPRQIFQYPTIAELTAMDVASRRIQAEQGEVTGQLPLTPIQRWFFEQNLPDPHHFNQSALLEVREPFDSDIFKAALQRLLEHHDALRLRFRRSQSGWQQFNVGADEAVPFGRLDLSSLPEPEQGPAIESAATEIQASLNLSEGPVIKIVYFDLGVNKPGRLLIVIHHLAVDGVSWRILLEDLQSACAQLRNQQEIKFPQKTTSFKCWAERLTSYAQSAALCQEAEHWLSLSEAGNLKLPVDHIDGPNTKASARTVSVSLSAEETRSLLQDVPSAYRTEINDVLLTALARAFAMWTGKQSLLIDLEGHGREEISDDMDLSRTVGWFTAIFPVFLNLESAFAAEDALKTVKEQLRRIPNRGIGYGLLRYLNPDSEIAEKIRRLPQAEVSFNYLGQFDQVLTQSSSFAVAKEHGGSGYSKLASRSHMLEVSGLIAGGRLRLDLTYSENIHQRATIEELAQTFLNELQRLIAHCQSPEAVSLTPSDFAQFNWSQSDLDSISAAISKSRE